MSHLIAIYDACVLYPAPLRDLLIGLAATALFKARWTDQIHEEWIRNLLIARPDISPHLLTRTRKLMNLAIEDCLVTNYEPLIANLHLPDTDDRHVLAAAIQANAEVIVTFNQKDFPEKILLQYGIVSKHPDHFIVDIIQLNPNITVQAIHNQRARLKKPPKNATEFLNCLRAQQLTKTSAILEEMIDMI